MGERVSGRLGSRAASCLAVGGGLFLKAAGALAADRVETPSIFSPVSTPAYEIRELSFLVLGLSALIFVVVAGMAAWIIVRFRSRGDDRREPPQIYGSDRIEIAWTVVPFLIVVVLFLVTARYIYGIEGRAQPPEALEVTVIGNQWWWEIRYPKLGIVTANELHVPSGDDTRAAPAFITLQSADVVHSFWVPQLAGKMDVIPNKINRVWIDPRKSGTFVGQCAEFCGIQHAWMLLRVIVQPRPEFDRWVAAQQAAAHDDPGARAGARLFASLSCINCHTVRGTAANGLFGPDLTHLMSRETLGAGAARNDPESLRAWVEDPATFKPGALMPAMRLSGEELGQLTAYLQTLR
ncbi:MAG TPA: cytochrome c oxidase subunit II [Candidatus Binatia bacterium]|nr:cytochrome c oxidase subunit II [Candidatus Binatia bacterium]